MTALRAVLPAALRTVLLAALLPALCAQAADVQSLLAAPRQRIETADYRVTARMVRIDPGGARTAFPVTIEARWSPGVLRVLVGIGQPSGTRRDMRAHILLEMRPGGSTTIRIARPGDAAPTALPFDEWDSSPFGAGFSYEDFLEQQYFWPRQTSLGEAKFGARDCALLLSRPDPEDRTHYAQVKTWLDQRIGFPVYVEKTLKESGAVKEFTYYGLRHNGGVWSASQVEEKTRGRGGSALLMIERGSARANLSLGDFSLERLTRF
jgi:hypothetical protein